MAEFAQALLVIPKTLSANAAKDSTDLVAKLRAYHTKAQNNKQLQHLKWLVFLFNCYIEKLFYYYF